MKKKSKFISLKKSSTKKETVWNITVPFQWFNRVKSFVESKIVFILIFALSIISIFTFIWFYQNGMSLLYNDARSHLDIGRRVVEGLKPGLAQLGSVWLPLPHILMMPTIWNSFMWHSGLSGAVVSMISFVVTGMLVYFFLNKLGVGLYSRVFGSFIFAANLNILYLQSTAMTEILLMATMTAGAYYFLLWSEKEEIFDLIKSAFFIMLSTLVRYDGWFLFMFSAGLIVLLLIKKKSYKKLTGTVIFFSTLAGLGVFLWFLWNLLIFSDPLYFAFGPFSAHAQQEQLEAAGELLTKGNILLSIKVYTYAVFYNSYTVIAFAGLLGLILFLLDKTKKTEIKISILTLIAPFIFNIIALFLGHSVLFINGISGDNWFNVRYGLMLAPAIAVFSGYLMDKLKSFRFAILGIVLFVIFFAFVNFDVVTLEDALYGSSGKNVTEVSSWLKDNASEEEGFVLISAASHDAIIFTSGMPMKRFIHEGTGDYWDSAVKAPEKWARWVIVRTHDNNDLTWKEVGGIEGLNKYKLMESYPFADIYELEDEYLPDLTTEPVFSRSAYKIND